MTARGRYRLFEVTAELGGYRDLQMIRSRITRYRTEIEDEYYKRRPGARGDWGHVEARFRVWVHPEDYHAVTTSLGKLAKHHEITLKIFAYL